MPTEGADVPSVISILVVFFAFSVATIVLLWLMDMLVDALRWRIIDRRERYPNANQNTTTEPEGGMGPAPGDAAEGTRRPWWRRLFEE
ncbi:MAG: hypothetical protein M3305_06835 [Actinomycetota bacterium]|nr:hypothetical protein [Actinomycetota bacterium]